MTHTASIWMPIYWSDWTRDTAHLSLQEQGAYMALMREYWNNGGALEDDKTRLYRRCGSQTRSEKESVNLILETYFLHENGKYRHERIEKELANAMKNKENSINKARKAADARWNATSNAQAMHKQCPSPSPSPYSEPKGSSYKKTKAKKAAAYAPEFEIFWKAYPPNGASKAKAFECWQKARGFAPPDEILSAVDPYGEYCRLTDTSYCHATTWLNQQRWETNYLKLIEDYHGSNTQKRAQPPEKNFAGTAATGAFSSSGSNTQATKRERRQQALAKGLYEYEAELAGTS